MKKAQEAEIEKRLKVLLSEKLLKDFSLLAQMKRKENEAKAFLWKKFLGIKHFRLSEHFSIDDGAVANVVAVTNVVVIGNVAVVANVDVDANVVVVTNVVVDANVGVVIMSFLSFMLLLMLMS